MGVSQLIDDLCRVFTRQACYTRREFYLQILKLFTTFRKLPPFPNASDGDLINQEKALKNVAELIGSAARHATSAKEKKDSIDESILKADKALSQYLKNYCSIDLQAQYRQGMTKAETNDTEVAAFMQKVSDELQEKITELEKKRKKIIDLSVSEWSRAPEAGIHQISGEIKIEEDATLSMLIHRYMDHQLHSKRYNYFDLYLLHLNPQIYNVFPISEGDWYRPGVRKGGGGSTPVFEYITCVSQTTTIQTYKSEQSENRKPAMYLVFDRYDHGRRMIGNYNLPIEYTTGWLLQGTTSAGVVRTNSLDYTLYRWSFGEEIKTRDNELRLFPNVPELHYFSPAPTSAEPTKHHGSSNLAKDTMSRATPPTNHGSSAPATPQNTRDHKSGPPPGQAVLQPPSPMTVRSTVQPPTQHLAPLPQTVVPSAPSRAPPTDSSSGTSKPDSEKKGTVAKGKSTKVSKMGPDAYRMQHKASGGPNELIEDDNKRGGWFGSVIKSGLQKFGAYGSSKS